MKSTYEKKFVDIYNKEADAVFRFCYFRISDREKALEMMQETFLKFWTMLKDQKKINNERAVLFTICRNMVIDWYRKKKSISLEGLTEEDQATIDIHDESFEANIELHVEGKHVLEKINALQPSYRQVAYLRFVESLGPKEIAAILGETSNSVSVKINRAVHELRKMLGYQEV